MTTPASLRPLGATGVQVLPFSLGGEGVLRTRGRTAEAVAVILEALRQGIRYCDTAPAYAQSQDYYGEAFRQAGPAARKGVFLASKTHERRRQESLRLLDDSLRRLNTDYLDLWQLHDLRDAEDLDEIFSRGGAIEAVEKAKADGLIRFVGLTGHHDPAILAEAMRRYRFDSLLVAYNPADARRLPFLPVIHEARRQGMAVVAMKVLAAGAMVQDGQFAASDLIRYAAEIADTAIVGCASPAEVQANARLNREFKPLTEAERRALESKAVARGRLYDGYKRVG